MAGCAEEWLAQIEASIVWHERPPALRPSAL
jgi:hypothetical protein